jgi:hypothetical protein
LVHVVGRGHVHRLSGQSSAPPQVGSTTSGAGYGCTYTYTDPTNGATYHYCHAGAYQSPAAEGYPLTDGTYAYTPVYAPYVASTDYHSLWEVAVEDSTGHQIVEVGWRVYRPDGPDPRLFVNTWVNGKTQGYNNVFFNAVSTTPYYYAGMTLPTGTTPKEFGIQYYQGNWWVSYDNTWFGYFAGSNWGGTFTSDAQTQIFGEVSAGELYPCTDMGTGEMLSPGAAEVTNVGYYDYGPPVDLQLGNIEDPTMYDAYIESPNSFVYGGPGAC